VLLQQQFQALETSDQLIFNPLLTPGELLPLPGPLPTGVPAAAGKWMNRRSCRTSALSNPAAAFETPDHQKDGAA
jgi:hypothetical protein